MSIKLVAVDLDGTLVTSEKMVAPGTAEAVRRAAAQGIQVALATGRSMSECRYILEEIPQIRYAVLSTGALVVDLAEKKTMCSSCLTADDARAIYARVKDYDALVSLFAQGLVHNHADRLANAQRYTTPAMAEYLQQIHISEPDMDGFVAGWQGEVEKFHMFFATAEGRDAALTAVQDLDYFVTISEEADMEIMRKGTDKGRALLQLAAHLGLEQWQIMAIGDSCNDLQMLQAAGTAVVMANGQAQAKALADYIAPSNDESGVAWVLEQLCEGGL